MINNKLKRLDFKMDKTIETIYNWNPLLREGYADRLSPRVTSLDAVVGGQLAGKKRESKTPQKKWWADYLKIRKGSKKPVAESISLTETLDINGGKISHKNARKLDASRSSVGLRAVNMDGIGKVGEVMHRAAKDTSVLSHPLRKVRNMLGANATKKQGQALKTNDKSKMILPTADPRSARHYQNLSKKQKAKNARKVYKSAMND